MSVHRTLQGRARIDDIPDDPQLAAARNAMRTRIQYHRAHRRREQEGEPMPDFILFLETLKRLALSPITVPYRIIRATLTSPLTLSLVLQLALLCFLLLASSVFSVLAVGAFFYSWSIGGAIEVEGWLFYGSKTHRPPHVTVPIPLEKIVNDLRYDVQVELELVRPTKGSTEEMGNFMLSLEMRSLLEPNTVLIAAAQPSLPPPALPAPLLSLPVLPTSYIPCVLPWPVRSLCPSRLLGYAPAPNSKIRERRLKGGFSSPARGKDVVPLKKDLMEGVLIRPGRVPEATIGSVFVSIGREDLFEEIEHGEQQCKSPSREVKTTGWVVIRFVPRPTGVRWILSSHPLPPLFLLPPISLALTFSSSIFAFALITFLRRPRQLPASAAATTGGKIDPSGRPADAVSDRPRVRSEAELLAQREKDTFLARDKEEKLEERRRQAEWEEMQVAKSGGLRKIDAAGSVRSRVALSSMLGGSETTAASERSSAPSSSTLTASTSPSDGGSHSGSGNSASDSGDTITPSRIREGSVSGSSGSGSGTGTGALGRRASADSDSP